MKKHLYIILLILPLIGFGQGWEQTFGGEKDDECESVQQTSDSGFILLGWTYSYSPENVNSDVYLIKTDVNGNEVWSQTYGGGWDDFGRSVQQTTDDGYIITGRYGTSNGGVINLIKTDENGNEVWSQSYEGSIGRSVQQTTDGGYVIGGSIFLNYSWGNQILLMKTDESGNEEWSQTFGDEDGDGGGDGGYSVQQTNDGGYIITGHNSDFDIQLIKTDENGSEEWSQSYEGGIGRSVQQTNDGGYIIVGSTDVGEFNGYDVYLIKTDGNGNEQWSQTFGGTGGDYGYSIQQTNDDGYIIGGGTTSFGNGESDLYLIKTDESGNEEWSQTFGGISDDTGNSVLQTTDGGYIISGYTETIDDYHDIYLIKTDSQGNITSTIELPTPTGKRELIKTTNILGQENTTIKNQPLIEIYDDGSVEKKYIIE